MKSLLTPSTARTAVAGKHHWAFVSHARKQRHRFGPYRRPSADQTSHARFRPELAMTRNKLSKASKEFMNHVRSLFQTNPQVANTYTSKLAKLANLDFGKGSALLRGRLKEELFAECVLANIPQCQRIQDAVVDYSFGGTGISHKEIGWTGKGEGMAMSWSKGGHHRSPFGVPLLIVNTSEHLSSKKRLPFGFYMFPNGIPSTVSLLSNNKTDQLIPKTVILQEMQNSLDFPGGDYFIPFAYNHVSGRDAQFSVLKLIQ